MEEEDGWVKRVGWEDKGEREGGGRGLVGVD
jgi:hypothetical protein